jgi:RHS repeat-associated protein
MLGRDFRGEKYRFGFNGKENDNEAKGDGNQQDYGMRIYDSRLGIFMSADPLIIKKQQYPELSPYQFASLNPIQYIDLDGLEAAKWDNPNSIHFIGGQGMNQEDKQVYNKMRLDNDQSKSSTMIAMAIAIYPGVVNANETTKQKQFVTDPANSVAILMYEFATGTGKDNRVFNYDGRKGTFATTFISGRVLHEVEGKLTKEMKNITAAEFKKNGINFPLPFSPDHTTIPNSFLKHLTSNFSQLFVGGAKVKVSPTEDPQMVNVTITNLTTRNSLNLHSGSNYPRDGKPGNQEKPLSTITQTFIMSMKIDPSLFKQEEKKK